VNYLLTPDH
jgi:hypothetical protein